MVAKIKKHYYYWIKSSELTLVSLASTRLSSILFITGKFARFSLHIIFLLALKNNLKLVANYSIDQLITFFLVFNLFDLLGQFLYRGIYWFRTEIISGTFDYRLLKPISPLFQIMTKHTDFLDLPLLLVVITFLVQKFPQTTSLELLTFSLLSLAAMIILTSIHIVIASIGVITTEVDHTMWIFRDLSEMAKVPIDIYVELIRGFLTFVVPIAVIFTFPAKSLFGLISPTTTTITVTASFLIYFLSLKFWHFALTKYSSASS